MQLVMTQEATSMQRGSLVQARYSAEQALHMQFAHSPGTLLHTPEPADPPKPKEPPNPAEPPKPAPPAAPPPPLVHRQPAPRQQLSNAMAMEVELLPMPPCRSIGPRQ